MESEFNFSEIEKKWQKNWEEKKSFEVDEKNDRPKYYVLDMFPYPSGTGLHMGHAFTFTLGDIYARFKRLQGHNVLYPIGYDALGLPAENAAIKNGTHPAEYTKKSISNFMKQQKAMGWSYDWTRLVNTSDPEYYRWDQWIFLQMLKEGLAYRKKSGVNWCGKCNTVLANEQVVNGKCWRHDDTDVQIKQLEQWYFKTTKYADEFLEGLDKVDWPQRTKTVQKNWIGKSHGTEINFEVNGKDWPVFTTRPDTIYGVTFVVVSAQHPNLNEIVTEEQKNNVEEFLKKVRSVSEKDASDLEKEGAFTGSYAVNPINGNKIPIYTGNFVLADYGSGMVMAVPAHDKRDYAFAKKYNIEIKQVIDFEGMDLEKEAYVGEGVLINSEEFDGLANKDAIEKITEHLEKIGKGKKTVNYKLRDWLISRQRFWGTPIPIVYCGDCGIVPVPENQLPVRLPEDVKFGEGNPLETSESFMKIDCPKCGLEARRETDTMDTFVNSSWYFLRYADPRNEKEIFDKGKVDYWAPIDQYVGGPEHATMHLLYIRFYTKFLRDIGLLGFDEPAKKYFTQGIVMGEDGEKMSKSKGNVVEPLEMIQKYGADTLRLFLVSNGSADSSFSWDSKGMSNTFVFVRNVYEYFSNLEFGESSPKVQSKVNKSIEQVTRDVEGFKHNLAIIKLRALFSDLKKERIGRAEAESFVKMLHIYCPFMTEELWQIFGNDGFLSLADWPKPDEKKIDDKFDKAEQAMDKTVGDILNVLKILNEKESRDAEKVYVYVMPFEREGFDEKELSIRTKKEVKVYAVNDQDKYDPEGKAGKAKPGKPGIYLE